MRLTKLERDDVYSTVTIEMSRMFEILDRLYETTAEKEKALLMQQIDKAVTAGWKGLILPPA